MLNSLIQVENRIEPALVLDSSGRLLYRESENHIESRVIPFAKETITFMESDPYQLAFVPKLSDIFEFIFDSKKAFISGFAECNLIEMGYPNQQIRMYFAEHQTSESTIIRSEVAYTIREFCSSGEIPDYQLEYFSMGGVLTRVLENYVIFSGTNTLMIGSRSGSLWSFNNSPFLTIDLETYSKSILQNNPFWLNQITEVLKSWS